MANRPPAAGKGRPRGALNKATRAAKEAFALAFEEIGGVKALVEWGKLDANRTDFYKLYGKLIPQELNASGNISVYFDDPTQRPASGHHRKSIQREGQ